MPIDDWDTDGTVNVARGMITGNSSSRPRHNHNRHNDDDDTTDPPVTTTSTTTMTTKGPNNNNKKNIQNHRHVQQRHNKKALALLQRLETKVEQADTAKAWAAQILQDGGTMTTTTTTLTTTNDPNIHHHHHHSGGGVGCLQVEHEMERTTAVTQVQLRRELLLSNHRTSSSSSASAPAATATAHHHIYDLQLGTHYAPYQYYYDRSGRYSWMVGQQNGGHLAVMDCYQRTLISEIHLQRGNVHTSERIRDATFLQNFTLYATAQQNHVYIYDGTTGAEVHCLTEHGDPFCLSYLPHHWLLASIGRMGYLKYHDVSTGALVSTHRTKLGAPTALRYNPSNAILHAGHTNGTVTLWSPAQSTYLVKMKCSSNGSTAITDLAIDLRGQTMVTSSMDRQIRVWDLRMYRERHAYYCAAGVPTSLDISQRGLLGVGHAGHVTIWGASALSQKDASPYMHHKLGPAGLNHARGPVSTVRFRPFEDVCGIGHATGVSSIVVPGSGEPALDTSEYHTNPMEDTKQRRETEVRSLLDKLSPNMICLNDGTTAVGSMEEYDPSTRLERLREVQEAANAGSKKKLKGKKRGRSKIQTKLRSKQHNVIDQKMIRLREAAEEEKLVKEIAKKHGVTSVVQEKHETMTTATTTIAPPTALKRFFS
jgi:U3 small nucleolar RNA-associated protein 7